MYLTLLHHSCDVKVSSAQRLQEARCYYVQCADRPGMLQLGDPLDDMMTPQRTQLRAASDPPNGPIGRRQPPTYAATPPPHLPLTFPSPNYHHILFKLFCWEDNWLYSHICSILLQQEKSENWSLPQWWLPQGLEFLNFLYWLLQRVLTLWSDLSTGGLWRPKAAVLKFTV